MKHVVLSALTALCCTLFAAEAEAVPRSILLHPGGALIEEDFSVTPEQDGRTLRFLLPADADLRSLDLSAEGREIQYLSFQDATAPDAEPVLSLKKKLEKIQADLRSLEKAQQDADARLDFWRHPPVTLSDPAELKETAAIMEKELTLFQDAFAVRSQRLQELQEEEKLLQKKLQEAGNASHTQEAVLTLGQSSKENVLIHCMYHSKAAGWRPLYRLEALPDSSLVTLRLDAEIWQHSGRHWEDVELQLATADPRQSMTPPSLTSWIARPVQQVSEGHSRQEMMAAAPAALALPKSNAMFSDAAPVYRDGASFQSWDMGRCDFKAGSLIRLPLHQENIKADFSYVVRPSRSADAYLSAQLDMASLQHFPTGRALFLVDGVPAGSATFSLDSSEKAADNALYFGRDPLVTAEMKTTSQQSGRTGFIDRKRSYVWDWIMTVTNRHSRPVKVRVEDPAPQSRDEQIVMELQSVPPAQKADNTLFWILEIPAGQSSQISHKVQLSAPAEMKLWEGR